MKQLIDWMDVQVGCSAFILVYPLKFLQEDRRECILSTQYSASKSNAIVIIVLPMFLAASDLVSRADVAKGGRCIESNSFI